jgi:hypothetical protein
MRDGVLMARASVLVAPLGRRSLMESEPPTFFYPTVEDHAHGLTGEDMLEVRKP